MSCSPELEGYPFVATPAPIISQTEFLTAFEAACLVSPQNLATLDAISVELGLSQKRHYDNFGHLSYSWTAPDIHGLSPLELSVNRSNIIYEIVGDGTGLPTRRRTCTISGYLSNFDAHELKQARKRFETIAKGLDFSSYSGAYKTTPDDIEVTLELPQVIRFIDAPVSQRCGTAQRCSYYSPFTLEVGTILDRIP